MVVDLLDAALPHGSSRDPSFWPTWRQLLPHAVIATSATRHTDPDEETALHMSLLLDRIGIYRRSRGEPAIEEYERGRDLDPAILDRRRRILGDDLRALGRDHEADGLETQITSWTG